MLRERGLKNRETPSGIGKKPRSFPNINSEKVISLKGMEQEKIRLLKMKSYLNFNNFRLQIGKMQEDGNTIYSPEIIGLFVDYILNHTELDDEGNGKVVIQLWPDLAQYLPQNSSKGILTFFQEKKKIEDLIKEKLGEKGKNIKIEIQNVADNYPIVFDAIKDGKNGIIPREEPKLEEPLNSPLPIINYLAYHCQKDPKLFRLFYNTKPRRYQEQDGINHIPGSVNADYYPIVEIGIRLYEVLNGIYIQGGIDRQKVYDKIIYLILFGEDRISGQKLKLEDYSKLGELHDRLENSGNYKDLKMMQLYINLDDVKKEMIKQKKEKEKNETKQNKKGKIESGPIIICTILALLGVFGGQELLKINNENENQEKIELYLSKSGKKSPIYHMPNAVLEGMRKFQKEQRDILRSDYDISRYDTKEYNKILEEYDDAFTSNYELYQTWLSAKDFIKANRDRLAKNYKFFPDIFGENSEKVDKE